jgi:hypothetical protein
MTLINFGFQSLLWVLNSHPLGSVNNKMKDRIRDEMFGERREVRTVPMYD